MKRIILIAIITMIVGLGVSLPQYSLAKEQTLSKVEKIAQEMKKSLEYKRMLLLEKLSAINTQEAQGLIIRTMIRDKAKPVRRTAQRLLQGVEDPRIAEQIIAGLESDKRRIRLAAIDVAGIVREPQMAEALVQTAQLYSKDVELVLLVLESIRELTYRMDPPKDFEVQIHPFLDHRNKKVRQTAIVILSIMGRPTSLQPLMAVWPKAKKRVKTHLIDAFSNMGRIAPVPLLLEVLKTKDKVHIMHALYALAQIQSFATLPEIYTLVRKQKDPRIRMACLYAMVEIPDQESIPVILELLDTQDPSVLHWATYALAQLDATSAGPQLIEKLDHSANLVRATAAMALGDLKISAAREPLLEIVTNLEEAPEVNAAAARALIQLGDPKGVEVLWKTLQNLDLNLESRLAYALAVGMAAKEDMQADVREQLNTTKFTPAFTAALILGLMGDASGREKLITALEHGYPNIRRYAILGLEGILDEKSIRALADTANDDRDPLVRILCASSLVQAGYMDFRLILWNALDTKEEDIRSETIAALGRSADDEIIYQLKWYLKREPSIPVRQTIQRVIREYQR